MTDCGGAIINKRAAEGHPLVLMYASENLTANLGDTVLLECFFGGKPVPSPQYAESRPRPICSSYAKGHHNRSSSLAAYLISHPASQQRIAVYKVVRLEYSNGGKMYDSPKTGHSRSLFYKIDFMILLIFWGNIRVIVI